MKRYTIAHGRWSDAALLLLAFALMLFVSPLFDWLIDVAASWYLLYFEWALIIVLAIIIQRVFRHHDV